MYYVFDQKKGLNPNEKESSSPQKTDMKRLLSDWSHECTVCGLAEGVFIECCEPQCANRFHVLCAWFGGYHMRVDIDHTRGSIIPKAYCVAHTPAPNGGPTRNLRYFKQLRGYGRTDDSDTARACGRARQLLKRSDFEAVDTYEPERCAVCFDDRCVMLHFRSMYIQKK